MFFQLVPGSLGGRVCVWFKSKAEQRQRDQEKKKHTKRDVSSLCGFICVFFSWSVSLCSALFLNQAEKRPPKGPGTRWKTKGATRENKETYETRLCKFMRFPFSGHGVHWFWLPAVVGGLGVGCLVSRRWSGTPPPEEKTNGKQHKNNDNDHKTETA